MPQTIQPPRRCPSGLALSALVDGELPPHLAALVGAHAARCGPCRGRLRGLLESDLLLRIQPTDRAKAQCPSPEILLLYPHLDAEARGKVDLHLSGCDPCLEYLVFVRGVEVPAHLLSLPRRVRDRARGSLARRLSAGRVPPRQAPSPARPRPWWIASVAATAALVLLSALIVLRLAGDADPGPSGPVAAVEEIHGAPRFSGIVRQGGGTGTILMGAGARVVTGPGDALRIRLSDGSVVAVHRFSGLRVLGPREPHRQVIGLEEGEIHVEVSKQGGGFLVVTPLGTATALGTSFHVRVNKPLPQSDIAPDRVEVAVEEGVVRVENEWGRPVLVEPGMQSVARRNQEPSDPRPADAGRASAWRLSLDRPGRPGGGSSDFLGASREALAREISLPDLPVTLGDFLRAVSAQTGLSVSFDPAGDPILADPFLPERREGPAGEVLGKALSARNLGALFLPEGLLVYRKGAVISTSTALSLLRALDGASPAARAYAGETLLRLDAEGSLSPRVLLTVLEALRPFDDPDPCQHLFALKALTSPPLAGERATIPHLVRALRLPSEESRREAATALGHLGGEEALAALRGGLADPAPRVRETCAHALGAWSDASAVPPLVRLREDPDPVVRKAAEMALARMRE